MGLGGVAELEHERGLPYASRREQQHVVRLQAVPHGALLTGPIEEVIALDGLADTVLYYDRVVGRGSWVKRGEKDAEL